MAQEVRIIEKESNTLISEYPVVIVEYPDGMDADVTDSVVIKSDYFNEAWQKAVDDGLVEISCRENYEFVLVEVEKLEDLTNPPNDDHVPNP